MLVCRCDRKACRRCWLRHNSPPYFALFECLPIPEVPEAVKAIVPPSAYFVWEDRGRVETMAREAGIALGKMNDEPVPVHGTPGPLPPPPEPKPMEEWPRLLRSIARKRIPGDAGLGDTLQRLFARLGGEWLKAAIAKLGIDCGCANRQAWLNHHYPYQD